MPLIKMEHSPTTKSTTTLWTASGMRAKMLLRSTVNLEKCSPNSYLTEKRREHMLWKLRLGMELLQRDQTVEVVQIQVGVTLCNHCFYYHLEAILDKNHKTSRKFKSYVC